MFIIIVNKKDLYSIHWYLEAEKKKKKFAQNSPLVHRKT